MSIDVHTAIRSALGPAGGLLHDGAVRAAADGVLRAVGNFPIGDPNAMRAAAARLREIATRTRQEADRMNTAVERCASWAGPARNVLAARVRDTVHHAHQRAARLENSANALTAAAGRVEQSQHQWNLRMDYLRNDAVHQLRALAERTRL